MKGPAIVLGQLDFRQVEDKYFDGSQKLSDWFATNTDIVRAYANKEGSVQAAVCIRHAFIQIGIYRPDNIAAVREDWDVRVLRWPSGEVLAGKDFPGQAPPPEIKATTGQYGKQYDAPGPDQDAKRWLNELIQ